MIFKSRRQDTPKEFERIEKDSGVFIYDGTGFYLNDGMANVYYNWGEIETVFAYKQDLLTTDEITLDIFFGNKPSLRISESLSGWYQFNKKLSENFPSIADDWIEVIALPAFETNFTLLFDRSGRTKDQAEASSYQL